MNSTVDNYFKEIKDKKIAVVGIGVSNVPLIKYFAKKGIKVTAFDKRDRNYIGKSYDEILQLGIDIKLGENYLEGIENFDIIFKTPGMRYDIPEFLKAMEKGAVITSEMELFFELCPCKIIGVTGSDGKTTTTTLISEFLNEEGYKVYKGGNIGIPLLSKVEEMQKEDFAVVELSSFQLHTMKRSPDIAIVTNVAPNHLDWHIDMNEYIDSKKNIFRYQKENGILIVNRDNDISYNMKNETNSEIRVFSFSNKLENGIYFDGQNIIYSKNGSEEKILDCDDIILPGNHNIQNYMTAILAVSDFVKKDTIRKVAKTFKGVEHRIEFVRELDGVKYYNSSIDSSPTRTIACLKSFKQKVIVISGGYDKKIPFEPLAPVYMEKAKALFLCGATTSLILNALISYEGYDKLKLPVFICNDFEKTIKNAKDYAKPGDIVVLSPACASFDMFKNFEQRGNKFKEIVNNFEE